MKGTSFPRCNFFTLVLAIFDKLFLLLCRHHDIIAQVRHARQIAKKLYPVARMIELPGAHLVSHERRAEVYLRYNGNSLSLV